MDPQDGRLTLRWTAATSDGTLPIDYTVAWGNGGSSTVTGTTATPSGLDNDVAYTFTVRARNDQGFGPPVTIQGQSAGRPAAPGAPTYGVTTDATSNSAVVVLSWAPVSPNGIAPTSYIVERDGQAVTCADPTATTCTDAGIQLNGSTHIYSITAKNAAATSDADTAQRVAGRPHHAVRGDCDARSHHR